MKKLGKKILTKKETIESYCSGCACANCSCTSGACATCQCMPFPVDLSQATYLNNYNNPPVISNSTYSDSSNSSYYSNYNY